MKEPRIRGIVITLLFLGFFLFIQYSHAQELMSYDFPNVTTTIHSVPEGGAWNRTSTWVEGRRPEAGDVVQINGRVVVDAGSITYAEYAFAGMYITEGSEVYHQSGSLNMDIDNIYLESDTTLDASTLHSLNIYNYGNLDVSTVYPESALYNYGTVSTVKIETNTSKTLTGMDNSYIILESNTSILNNPNIGRLSLGTHTLTLLDSESMITVADITSTDGVLNGTLRLYNPNGNVRFNVIEMTADQIIVDDQVDITKDGILNTHILVNSTGIIHHSEFGPAHTITINGDLDVQSGGILENLSGTLNAHIYGNIVNAGMISSGFNIYAQGDVDTDSGTIDSLYLAGTEPKTLLGLDQVRYTDLQSDITSNNDLTFNELRARDYHISFVNNVIGTITLNDILRSDISTTGNIIINENMSSTVENITANTTTLDTDTYFQFTREAHVYTNLILNSGSYMYWPYAAEPLYLHGDVLVKPTAQLIPTASSTPLYLAASLDMQGETSANNYHLFNADTSTSYTFAYSEDDIAYTEITQPEPDLTNVTLHTGSTTITNIINDGTLLYWKTKTAEDLDYGDTHTINQALYLEPDTEFFTVTLPEGDLYSQNTVTLNITAKDPGYTNTINLSINDTETTTVDIIDGTGTIDIMLPYEDDDMVVSVSEDIFSGGTDTFLVLPALQLLNFFIINHDDPVAYGTTTLPLSITTPTNPTYTGIAQITIPPDTTVYDIGMIDGSGSIDIPISGLVQGTYAINVNEAHRSGSSIVTVQAQPSSNTGSGSYSRSITERIIDLFIDNDEETENEEGSSEEDPETEQREAETTEADTAEPDIVEVGACTGINPNDLSLRVGSRNDSVKVLQAYLNSKGYDSGPIDGDFGPGTKSALQEFQADNGLVADGIFGVGSYNYVEDNCDSIENKVEVPITEDLEVVNDDKVESTPITLEKESFIDIVVSPFVNALDWFKNLFNKDRDRALEILIDEAEQKEAIRVYTDNQGREVVDIVDPVKLDELIERFNIKLPTEDKTVKDEYGDEILVPIPEEVIDGKILDVPYVPQQMYYKDNKPVALGTPGSIPSPVKRGTSMCTGASAIMIAAYYDALPEYQQNNISFDGEVVDEGLREFVWKDKLQSLGNSCVYQGFNIDGAFATTSLESCNLGYVGGYNNYFKKENINLNYKHLDKKFSSIKSSLEKDRPVMFGEPGHVMVAVGYADFHEKQKIKVNIQGGQNDVLVDTQFILITHDPKRNRNRSKNITIENQTSRQTFAADGGKSAYLIVSLIDNDGKKKEYMCRSSKSDDEFGYSCIKFGNVSMEVYK